ncbi:MAG TPA: hypothetical protein VH594_04030 [Trebonia sp.]
MQYVALGHGERPREEDAKDAGDDDVGVHLRVLARARVLRDEDALADAGAAADQLGDDVDDQRDRDRDAQAGRDERRGARQGHREKLARTADLQHGGGVARDGVEGADAIADLDDQRPEYRERDQREFHRERRAPQDQADRQDRDHRDGLEELDHADDAPVREAVHPDERAEQQRGGDADDQAKCPAFEGLADRRPEHGLGDEVPECGRGLGHRGELISPDDPRRAQPLPEAERGGEDGKPQPVRQCAASEHVTGSRSWTRPAARR